MPMPMSMPMAMSKSMPGLGLWRLAWTLLLATEARTADYGHCVFPLGMQSGAIPDTALSASSSFEDSTTGPQNARVRIDRAGGAWCPKNMVGRESSEWLEVDLGSVHTITAVETQGRFGNGQGVEFAEAYFIEYYRPRLARWVRYRSLNGTQVQTGNANTYLEVKTDLWPAITASRIRIVPFSQHKRTVCIRLELYGCQHEGGLLSYSMAQGDRLGRGEHALELVDWNYDGVVANNRLAGGLGALTDNNRGPADFKMAFYPQHRGWVGWKRPAAPSATEANADPFVDLMFEFDSARQFHTVDIFSSNQFSRDVFIFRQAVATFSVDGEAFGDAVTHVPMEDPVLENPRNVTVRLHGQVASYVNLRLYFAAKWLIVSEVTFDSSPASAEMVRQRANAAREAKEAVVEMETEAPAVLMDESENVEDAVLMPVVVGVLTTVVLVLAVVLVLIVCKSRRVAKWREGANRADQHTDDDESARMVCDPASLVVTGSLPSPYPYAFCASTSESSSANNNSLKSSGVATPLARRGTPTVYFPPPPASSLPKLPVLPVPPTAAAQSLHDSHLWQEAEYAEPNVDLSNSLSSSGAYAEPYAATTLMQYHNTDGQFHVGNMVNVGSVGSVGHVHSSPRFGHPPLTPRRLLQQQQQHQYHFEDADYRSSSDSSSCGNSSSNHNGTSHKRPAKRAYRSYQRKDSDSDHRKMSHRRRQN